MRYGFFIVMTVLLVSLSLPSAGLATELAPSSFLYFSLGVADISYPDEVQRLVNWLKTQGQVQHKSIGIEAPGLYWSYGKKTLVGPVVGVAVDHYSAGGSKVQVNQFLVALSSMYFPTGQPSQGPFLRSDVGLAWASVDSVEGATSDRGLGALVGIGYAARVASGTKSLLNLNYTVRKMAGESYKTIAVSVGVLL